MVSRQKERGEVAYNQLCIMNKGNIDWIATDLSSLESVRRLVETINNKYPRVNFLFNCAGIQLIKRTLTTDGLESNLATNYLGHFLLTNFKISYSECANSAGRGFSSYNTCIKRR
jgi:NAD(P)-dependent dehydrogenase (short-subunit alcohol dehydrogenase family)